MKLNPTHLEQITAGDSFRISLRKLNRFSRKRRYFVTIEPTGDVLGMFDTSAAAERYADMLASASGIAGVTAGGELDRMLKERRHAHDVLTTLEHDKERDRLAERRDLKLRIGELETDLDHARRLGEQSITLVEAMHGWVRRERADHTRTTRQAIGMWTPAPAEDNARRWEIHGTPYLVTLTGKTWRLFTTAAAGDEPTELHKTTDALDLFYELKLRVEFDADMGTPCEPVDASTDASTETTTTDDDDDAILPLDTLESDVDTGRLEVVGMTDEQVAAAAASTLANVILAND